MRHRRRTSQQILQTTVPVPRRARHSRARIDVWTLQMFSDRVNPRIAVGKRLGMHRRRDVVQLQVIVGVDQTGEDQMIAQIETERMRGRGTGDATRREGEWACLDSIVMYDVRILQQTIGVHRDEPATGARAPLRSGPPMTRLTVRVRSH